MSRPAPLPQVWTLHSYRAGENTQILALAEALGWPFQEKVLHYRALGYGQALARRPGSRGFDRKRSSPLVPPWPDLVISAGFRNEPVVRWIQQQSRGKTRTVQLGRTWAAPDNFDLVITTPQYRLPEHNRILHNHTTLHRITADGLRQAAATWTPRLEPLPAPYIAVLVGGDSGPYHLGPRATRRLAHQLDELARRRQATLLVTTSSRTSPSVARQLRQALTAPHHWHAYGTPGENPYLGYLALASALVVTGDSISMLSEACATGKPVYLFDIGGKHWSLSGRETEAPDTHLKSFLYRRLLQWGPRRLGRDIRRVHQQLIADGNAVWMGDEFSGNPPPLRDRERAVQRVRELIRRKAD